MKDDISVLEEIFNYYYKKAEASYKNDGDIKSARENYYMAAETLSKIASKCTGEIKKSKLHRVDRLLSIVEELDVVRKQSSSTNVMENSRGKSGDENRERTKWISVERPKERFNSIFGMDYAKKVLTQKFINPFKYKELYKLYNADSGGGVLLYGPPGTGKTMMGRALAGEIGCNFYYVRCSDIFNKYVGESEQNVKNLFEQAKKDDKAIIFFDDCEAIMGQRSEDEKVDNRIISELLTQIDGFYGRSKNILLFAATNLPWKIDTGILRSGRFDERIYVPLPDEKTRELIIKKAFEETPLADDVDIAEMVYATEGYNGSDLVRLCANCKTEALERNIAEGVNTVRKISSVDIAQVMKQFSPSASKAEIEKYEKYNLQFRNR